MDRETVSLITMPSLMWFWTCNKEPTADNKWQETNYTQCYIIRHSASELPQLGNTSRTHAELDITELDRNSTYCIIGL